MKMTDEQALKVVKTALQELNPQPIPEDLKMKKATGLMVVFKKGEKLDAVGLADILKNQERFLFSLQFNQKVSKAKAASLVHLLTLINNELILGNFDFDYEQDGITFKISVDFAGTNLREKDVKNAVSSAIDSAMRYVPKLVEIL